jgi:hypothetical protein
MDADKFEPVVPCDTAVVRDDGTGWKTVISASAPFVLADFQKVMDLLLAEPK